MALTNQQIAQYLKVAYDQRSRALNKARDQYGPQHIIVSELTNELVELNRAIADLLAPPAKK